MDQLNGTIKDTIPGDSIGIHFPVNFFVCRRECSKAYIFVNRTRWRDKIFVLICQNSYNQNFLQIAYYIFSYSYKTLFTLSK